MIDIKVEKGNISVREIEGYFYDLSAELTCLIGCVAELLSKGDKKLKKIIIESAFETLLDELQD